MNALITWRWLHILCRIAGMKNEDKSSPCLNMLQQHHSLKEDSSSQPFGLSVPYSSPNERNGLIGVAGIHSQQTPPHPGKQFCGTMHLALDSSVEAQVRNGRPRADARGRSQLLPRYWPRCTELELQQISIEYPSNHIIITLLYIFLMHCIYQLCINPYQNVYLNFTQVLIL